MAGARVETHTRARPRLQFEDESRAALVERRRLHDAAAEKKDLAGLRVDDGRRSRSVTELQPSPGEEDREQYTRMFHPPGASHSGHGHQRQKDSDQNE